MKKLNVIYNHYIFDEPYKQSEVKMTEKRIHELLGEVEIYITFTSADAPSFFKETGDLIIAEHSFAMTGEEKRALADVLRGSVTRLKKYGQADVAVSFRRIEEDDLYFFEA